MTPIYDTLIIGAGIAGASLAYRLAGQRQQGCQGLGFGQARGARNGLEQGAVFSL